MISLRPARVAQCIPDFNPVQWREVQRVAGCARCSETRPQCADLLPPVKTENSSRDKSGAPSGQSRKSDQSFSVASFDMPLPTGLCFLKMRGPINFARLVRCGRRKFSEALAILSDGDLLTVLNPFGEPSEIVAQLADGCGFHL